MAKVGTFEHLAYLNARQGVIEAIKNGQYTTEQQPG